MPRLPRICPAGIAQHIIQRGNNRQNCFSVAQDYALYINCLHEAALQDRVDIHAWVLMTNHVHLLATPHIDDGISLMMQAIGRKYVRYFNLANGRTGTLWEGRFRSCLVSSDDYLLTCYRYIELNPVRAKLSGSPADYSWSSYPSNALGKKSKLITFHPNYLALGDTETERQTRYQTLIEQIISTEMIAEIRNSTQQNLALGSAGFKTEMENRYRRRLRLKRKGRPKKTLQGPSSWK